MEAVANEVGTKLDRVALAKMEQQIQRKAEQSEIDRILAALDSDKHETDTRMADQLAEVESYMNLLKDELEKVSNDVLGELHRKADNTELDKITNVLMNKTDLSQVTEMVSITRNELSNVMHHSEVGN